MRLRAGRFGLDIVMVNVWESVAAAEEARHFCEVWGLEGTVLLDETGAFARELGVRGVPTNVVVGADGIVRAVGVSRPAELADAITDLLGTPDW